MHALARNTRPVHVADARINALLGRWLSERKELLARYWALSEAVKTAKGAGASAVRSRLDRFCEVLVDYVSAGHFEVFRALIEQYERRGGDSGEEATALYRLILPTTHVALDFNDRYFRGGSGAGFARDLSRLGQVLASRFDWEDALIRGLAGDTQDLR